ncbi:3-oxoacyl-ACP reductase FabG [Mucilaginibacter celer]|uniref:3-oxoacyl-ACP reductase FabG n=1 Tax=Mucilaginibacter celer TaxID=2305508 RepID=A0A494VX28_9SPHI|nr:3-oxoacyl-ACP reductase FabG [Mucilaginibacter celer]AYL98020.1 3-oxoacyl-ACP reductase FabG [Mucilaginibacter celer]
MKCALVTGGSRGIGRAICYKMAAMGYYVLVNYKGNVEEANNTLAQIKENGGDGELLQFDVADKNDIQQKLGSWIETNTEKYIEVLINNAGIKDDGLMMWMKDEQWDGVLNTSLNGFFYVTRLVLNGMLVKKYGRIVNVVSLSGLKGLPGQVNYSAAKAGVIGATKALAQEVGRRGVTVNAVAPGFIATDMTAGLDEKELKAMVPLKRFGTPEEVAHAVGFLASAEAAYITAEVLSINGGLYS